jgi:hypothetical protein
MPALIDRVTNWLRRARADGAAPAAAATTEAPPQRSATPEVVTRLQVEHDRRTVVSECREMYRSDPRAEGVVDSVARDAVKGGFRLKVSGATGGAAQARRAQEAAEAMLARLRLAERLDDYLRLTLRDGDSFLEVVVSEAREIVALSRKPALEMHRHSDRFDRFPDPRRAYWWSDAPWSAATPARDAVWLADWQVVHARWSHDEGERYGRPLFASARGAWKRIREGEIDVAIRRKTRAGLKYIHALEGASEADLEAYKERNKAILDNPFAAVADFFSSKKTTITAVQGDARLGEIEDVKHHIRTFFIGSPMPMALLGYGEDLNRDVLQEQEEQYRNALEGVATWAQEQLIVPLLELQWLLAGILPETLTYTLQWAHKRPLTPADVVSAADAVARLKATGLLTEETLLRILSLALPDFDPEAEAKALAAQRAASPQPDEVGRMGGLLGQVEG